MQGGQGRAMAAGTKPQTKDNSLGSQMLRSKGRRPRAESMVRERREGGGAEGQNSQRWLQRKQGRVTEGPKPCGGAIHGEAKGHSKQRTWDEPSQGNVTERERGPSHMEAPGRRQKEHAEEAKTQNASREELQRQGEVWGARRVEPTTEGDKGKGKERAGRPREA